MKTSTVLAAISVLGSAAAAPAKKDGITPAETAVYYDYGWEGDVGKKKRDIKPAETAVYYDYGWEGNVGKKQKKRDIKPAETAVYYDYGWEGDVGNKKRDGAAPVESREE